MTAHRRISFDNIQNNLSTTMLGRDLYVLDEVTSTFDACEKIGVCHGTVVCAKRQTDGTGRLGRSWESNEGGIYFSLILEPSRYGFDIQLYTLICALGVQRAISEHTACMIKWPNDIVSPDGRKLCGILTKIKLFDSKAGFINVGIGINANNKSFSDDLKYAGSLCHFPAREVDENRLLCSVLSEIEKVLCLSPDSLVKEFAEVCVTVGSRVKIVPAEGEKYAGNAKGISKDGSLMVEKDDGSLVCVNSGEVSVRGIYGENYV